MRKWFGFCLMAMLLVLAGTTAFADEILPGERAYSTYYPNAVLQKIWEDNDNVSGTRPETLDVKVAYLDYNGVKQFETVTLSQENGWSYTFPGEWEVAIDQEIGLPSNYRLKYDAVEERDGGYLLTLVNGLLYPVSYTWEWEGEDGNYQSQGSFAGQYLPGDEQYAAGEDVISNNAPYTHKYYPGSTATQDGVTYIFEGWDPAEFTMPAEAVTVNGQWKRAKEYKVSYEWTGLPENATVQPPAGGTYMEGNWVYLDRQYQEGAYVTESGKTYRFSGWSTEWDGWDSYSSFRMPARDVVFEGIWEEVTDVYQLNYKWAWIDDDGRLSEDSPAGIYWGSLSEPRKYAAGAEVSRDYYYKGYSRYSGSGPTYQLYLFSGWKNVSYNEQDDFNAAEEMAETFSMPAADTTLYGVWKKVPTYTVKYEWTFEGLSTPPSSPRLYQPSSPYYAGQKRCGRNTDYIDGFTCVVNGQMYEFFGWTAYNEQGTAQLSDLEFDEYGYFTMPEQNVLFKGEWKKVPSYTVTYQWDGLPKNQEKDTEGYECSGIEDAPGDDYSPYKAGAKVYQNNNHNRYILADQDGVENALRVTWIKFDYNTYTYDQKYTYYRFSGWTAYDKDSYTGNGTDQPLNLEFDEYSYFTMPAQNILFVGRWEEIPVTSYTVSWFKLESEDAEPDTAERIARRPNPDTRMARVDSEVSVTERDIADINEYTTYTFLENYKGNIKNGTATANGTLALKLYFVQKTPPVEDKNHTLTIRYVDEADLSHELATTYSQTNLKKDDVYSVKSPTIPGYELSDETQAIIKGVMPGEDVLVVVKYRQIPSVTYTVRHEYYTDGSLTGTYEEVKSGMVGEKISKDSIELRPTYQEVPYTYKSTSPDEITLVADQARSNSQGFVVKYERTTGTGPDEPISAAYTVRHEYYTDGSLTGTYEEVRSGMVGEKISKDLIELRPTYQEVTYTYKSTSPDEITLVAGQTDSDSQEFVLTYERTTGGESDEPTEPGTKPTEPGTEPTEPGTKPTEPNTKPSKSTPTDDVPATGDDADLTLWLALMGGSGIGIIVVLAMFKMRHKGKRHKR